MTGYLDEFNCDETRDPYATRFCAKDNKTCYNSISRDPMRTPMQVRHDNLGNLPIIDIIFIFIEIVEI